MKLKIGQVTLFVKDITRMTAFYRDAVALPELPSRAPGEVECLDAGSCQLCLVQIPLQYARNIVITDPPQARSDTPVKLIFSATDIAATRAVLDAHGAHMQAVKSFEGRTYCDGLDPEGNVFQISDFS